MNKSKQIKNLIVGNRVVGIVTDSSQSIEQTIGRYTPIHMKSKLVIANN